MQGRAVCPTPQDYTLKTSGIIEKQVILHLVEIDYFHENGYKLNKLVVSSLKN
jgi:hypothetical protein